MGSVHFPVISSYFAIGFQQVSHIILKLIFTPNIFDPIAPTMSFHHSFYYRGEDLIMAHHHLAPEISNTTENKQMNLKKNLRELIRTQGITVVHLSRATGVPLQTLHGWLSGIDPRGVIQLKMIADYFTTTIDEICFGPTSPKQKKHINKNESAIKDYAEEINAGTFEVVLRRVKK